MKISLKYLLCVFMVYTNVMFTTPGDLDTSFDTDGKVTTDVGSSSVDAAYASAVQQDGKLVVVGSSASDMAMVRYTIAGALDGEFGTGGKVTQTIGTTAIAYGVAIQNDGKIVVCGSSDADFFVARFLPDGSLDTAGFNTATGYIIQSIGTTDIAYAVAINPEDQKIIVAGTSDNAILVAQFTTAGALDTAGFNTTSGYNIAVNPGTTDIAYAIAIQPSDQQIVIAGRSDSDVIVARYSSAGILDTAGFNTTSGYIIQSLGGTDIGYGVAFQSTGKIIVSGTDGTNAAVARFTTAGLLDTTFGISISGYNIANTFAGTSAIAYGVAVQADDSIVIGGTAINITTLSDFVIARYLADGSALDTATFSPSNGYTTTDFGTLTVDIGRTLTMQSNGRFIVAGTTDSNNNDFAVARYDGDAAPQGCMDVTYQSGISPGFTTYPTDVTAANKPQVKALQALSNNKVYVVTEDLATATKSQLVQLNADGTNALTTVNITQIGAIDVIVDSQQRALVVGTASGSGWLRRSTSSTSLTADASFDTDGFVIETTNSSSFQRVGEQSSGRVVVIGQSNTAANGLLIGYDTLGALDTAGFGSASSGFITLASSTFYDMIIDENDGIYVAYKGTTGNISIAKYLANGSALDTSNFGTSGIVDTGLAIADHGTPSLTFDNNGKIVVAAVVTASGNILIQGYEPATGTTSVGTGTIVQTATYLSTPIITKLQCDTNNQLIFTGYDDNVFFIARVKLVTTTYSLEDTFSPYSSTPGMLKTMYNNVNPSDTTTPKRVSNCVCIAPSGAILFGGYENINSTDTVSVVGQVIGDTIPYSQVARYPGASVYGILDTSFGTNGALDLKTGITPGLPFGQPKLMNILASTDILIADADGTDTVLAQLNSAYALDTAGFGSTTGKITLTGLVTPTALMVDTTAANYYVIGQNSTPVATMYKVNSAGTTGGAVLATTILSAGYAITQQASGRILVSGYSSTNSSGVIVAYTPAGVLDTSFNPGGVGGATPNVAGYWYTGIDHPIMSVSVGNVALDADKIFFAYENGSGDAVVDRLLENGTALDTNFTFGTAIASISSETQIKMQLDKDGKIALTANTGPTAGIQAARYAISGANDVATATIIANTSGQELENIVCLSDGTTLILGAVPNATASSAFMNMAALNSSYVLDTSFNPLGATPGILSTNVPVAGSSPVMKSYYGMDVIGTGGILVTGDNSQTASSADPYLTAVESLSIVTKVSQNATSTPDAGILDTTFNPEGTDAGFMNLADELQTTDFGTPSQAKKLLQLSTGIYFIAADDGTDSYITKMSDDDVQMAAFNTTGVLTLSSQTDISDMMITQLEQLLVIGGSGGSGSNSGWINLYNATTAAADGVFAPTDTMDVNLAVAQQTNGRIIVAGQDDGFGTLIAYNSVTGAVDTTFAVSGRYVTAYAAAINAMTIDANDDIYFVVNDDTNLATTKKLSADGTLVDWTGSTTVANSTVTSNNHVAVDQAGNIVIAVVDTTIPQIVVKRYAASTGTESETYNLTNGVTGFTTPVVTSLLIDLNTSPGKIILTGYDDLATDKPFVLRMLANITGGLDTSFNTTGIQSYDTVTGGTARTWFDAIINDNGKITVAGYAVLTATNTPYLMRVYGDEFIGQYDPAIIAGTQGTINTNFGTSGELLLAGLSGGGSLAGLTAQVVLPTTSGQYYIACTSGALIRLTNGAILDTSFDTDGFASASSAGVQSMIIDGLGSLVLAGTTGGAAWLQRYNSGLGTLDTTFNSAVSSAFPTSTLGTIVIEQTLGRYIVAGQGATNGALFAFTDAGALDTTFNSTVTPGSYDTGVATGVYAMVADQYDRLIIAYKNSTNVDVVRLTSAGQLDTSFDTDGIFASAITGADDETQVRVVLDNAGNVIVVAHTSSGISLRGLTTTGTSLYSQLDISTIITSTPVLTNLIATSDGNVLVSGYQATTSDMWVARVTVAGGLDGTFGGADGIMTFSFDGGASVRNLAGIAVYGDGEIAMVGTETNGTVNPFLAMAYNNPYVTQVDQSPDSKTIGTNDITLGASSTTSTDLGVTFFASSGADVISGQVARSIALRDDNDFVVAVDGGLSSGSSTPSDIFLQVFNIDGVADTTFGLAGSGYRTVLTTYDNQYVQDMVTFTTVAGVHKAILVGYATNTALSTTSSLLLQYNVTTPGLDSSFGGLSGSPSGIAFGNGKQANVVGLQSNGRIIVGGQSQDDKGLLLGYTANGKMDKSFGSGGYLVASSTSNALYTHVIDTENRVVIAYRDTVANNVFVARFLADGSGLDTSFSGDGLIDTGIVVGAGGNNNMRIAVDASDNVVVAMIASDGTTLTINSYTAANGTPGTPFAPSLSLTAFTISRLLLDANGKVLIVGSDTNGASADQVVIARINTALTALDTTFNTSGYLKYGVAAGATQSATSALIHPDGRIVIVGSETA